MWPAIWPVLVLLLAVANRAAMAFAPVEIKVRRRLQQVGRPPSRHYSSISTPNNDLAPTDEREYQELLMRAKHLALSNVIIRPQQARAMLHTILHVQSQCAAGLQSSTAMCDNVDDVAAIVAQLRQHVATQLRPALWEHSSGLTVPLTLVGSVGAAAAAAIMALSTVAHGPQAEPFLWREWGWAVRDGYVTTMLAHGLHHGGLAAITAITTAGPGDEMVLPFQVQEWIWAARDGYVPTIVSHFMRHGGL